VKRRGFSILEISLAIAVGSMLMLLAMGLLGLMNRSTVSIADKADQAAQMHRARLILGRAFSQILSASPQRAQAQPPPEADAPQRARGTQGVGLEPDEVLDTDPAPRFWLDADPMHSGLRMTLNGSDGVPATTTPQRIEVVLAESPVPAETSDPFVQARRIRLDAERRGMYRSKPAGAGSAAEVIADPEAPDEEAENPDVRAFRGAFELRPQPAPKAPAGRTQSRTPRWELWWIPLPAASNASAVRERFIHGTGNETTGAFRVATDIKAFRARIFENRAWKERYASLTSNQLPAYIEVDIAMAEGISAHWLFEIGWAVGPEIRQAPAGTAPAADNAAKASGGVDLKVNQNPSGAAGANRAGTGTPSGKAGGSPGKERKK
jgi:prepilin-type N-terminal cleavage/methylation domain-containing protein